ncbi:craniofacial development protein 2-like [Montipora foliosa]|uniref:craniofacial development protein 2-like n=1 Tax=Montipora foliosa TaxID=591990 RepID=UPI0035F20E15
MEHVTETATTKTSKPSTGPDRDFSRVTSGRMTNSNESLSGEVRAARCSLRGPKAQIRIGAWNVRTMYETSKSAQVLREMNKYNLDILGVSECRWTGSGRQRSVDGSVILFSGHENTHINGVALIIAKKSVNTLLEWEPINDRILRARFDSKHCKLTIIQCTTDQQMKQMMR